MKINKEVLKGHIDAIILSLLNQRSMYGYELAKRVKDQSSEKFEIKEGTLYLSLKRLEKNAYVTSFWSDNQGPGGRRKYYEITNSGIEKLTEKRQEWNFIKEIIDSFMERSGRRETN